MSLTSEQIEIIEKELAIFKKIKSSNIRRMFIWKYPEESRQLHPEYFI